MKHVWMTRCQARKWVFSWQKTNVTGMVDEVALYIRNAIDHNKPWAHAKSQQRTKSRMDCCRGDKTKGFIVGTWFSPPGASIEIMNAFDTLLQNLEAHDLQTNILDDFNYEVSANPLNRQTSSFLMQFIPIFSVNSSPNTYNCQF